MNDKKSSLPQDILISRLLTRSTVIMELLNKGLPTMLVHSGCTPEFRSAVEEFVQPVISLIEEQETDVISFVRDEQNTLKHAVEIVNRRAETRTEWRLASQLKDFIREMIPEQGGNLKVKDCAFIME